MSRYPGTPDCAIAGCTRAGGKRGMCAEHNRLVPLAFATGCMAEVSSTSHRIGKKWARRAQAHVRAVLREQSV